ncbi:MAG: hypothetical protein ACJ72O_09285, partial [Marmoricola sp.]
DPNLVSGMCLRYAAKSGTGYTWIGSYRADNGKVFFCIDYLYDSRITSSAAVVDTEPLENQFGTKVGDAEVAALNYLISTWAPNGSGGSDENDAAIALIIREVMSDAIRPDGTVVYKPGLKVGGTVAAPTGGLPGGMLAIARSMWSKASQYRGPGRLVLAGGSGGRLTLGQSQQYRVAVFSASNHLIPGLKVTFTCTGPVSCPKPITTTTSSVAVRVTPTAVGMASIKASAASPAADGKLLKLTTWRTHAGKTAQDNGVQRGWIGQRNTTTASASVQAEIVKATPAVTTRTSAARVTPGTRLTDLVTVSGLPDGSKRQMTATLFGPMADQPAADSCTEQVQVGQVTFEVAGNGSFTTPPITVNEPGYYVWTESMHGDDRTNPVTTPCGLAEETAVVERPKALAPRTPTVHTLASAQHLGVGSPVSDTVVVAGLPTGSLIQVRWTLLGPVAPRRGSCSGLDWSHATTIAAGTFQVSQNGSYATRPVKVGVPGCVTYVEEVAATARTTAVRTAPGTSSETVLFTRRPSVFVPEIPSGPASSAGR